MIGSRRWWATLGLLFGALALTGACGELLGCAAVQRATDSAVEAEYKAQQEGCLDAGSRGDIDMCRNAIKATYGRSYDAGGGR